MPPTATGGGFSHARTQIGVPMSLAERSKHPPTTGRRKQCAMQAVLTQLPDDERLVLNAMLLPTSDWPASKIRDALIAEGIDAPSMQVIANHRRRMCACDQT